MNPSTCIPEAEAIKLLIEAKEKGRKIVPFLGAGISASSGFPLVDAIRLYLLKVRYFIQYGAYRDALGMRQYKASPTNDPERNPSRYLTDFGWPNPNQLNSDLYRVTRQQEKEPSAPFKGLDEWLPLQLKHVDNCPNGVNKGDDLTLTFADQLKAAAESMQLRPNVFHERPDRNPAAWIDQQVARLFQQELYEHGLREILKEDVNWFDELKKRERLFRYANVTRAPESRWGRGRWRLMTAALFAQLEDIRLYDQRLAEAIEEKIWKLELMPTTDWSRHLMQLSEGNLNLIDALISMLGLRYAPGLSHRMMAQLVKDLNLPLLLTINFDPYLEQSLQDEGITPRVLDVSRDDDPPDESVVKQALSIIKLHGSSHSIRLGKRLDYALDDDTRNRVERIVGDDALLLVVGFSGYERRMMQLIDHLATRTSANNEPRVVWMHFEPPEQLPETLKDFERRLDEMGQSHRFKRARLSDAGEFLFHFYQRAMEAYPRVRVPVSILPKRIIELPKVERKPQPPTTVDQENRQRQLSSQLADIPIHLFIYSELVPKRKKTQSSPDTIDSVSHVGPSLEMSTFVQERSKGYHLIWIDLEEHHTVAGVITEIIDRMRVFDPDLAPLILPVESTRSQEGKIEFDRAVRFLHRALRRGRYILSFDSLEDFGREQTSHHGLPSNFKNEKGLLRRNKLINRVKELVGFLKELLGFPKIDNKAKASKESVSMECV